MKKLYCFLFGHDCVEAGKFDNGKSEFGAFLCLRCGFTQNWQYDKWPSMPQKKWRKSIWIVEAT